MSIHLRLRLIALMAILLGTGDIAFAQTKVLRVAQQFGIAYLPMTVAKEKGLYEKQAAQLGLSDAKVEWLQFSGANAMNEGLISGVLDFASAGVAPLILTWDKTRSSAGFIGVAALGSMPNVLITNRPEVKSLGDFTDKDRIALPAVKVGFQPIVLQMAAEKFFGRYDKLDHLTVSLPHPDALVALVSGRSEITAHFTSPPFVQQELRDEKLHAVLSSYDVLGGPHTFNVVYATGKFVANNPKTVAAFVAALDEANVWIAQNPEEAARLYIAAEKTSLPLAMVEAIITDKANKFTTTPENTQPFGEFLFRSGQIKQKPASWRDYFWSGLHERSGS